MREKVAQLSIIFILLYYLGLRINELHSIGKKELESLITEGEISLVLSKRNGTLIKLIAPKGRELLKKYEDDINLLFVENNYKTITCSVYNPEKPMNTKQLIRLVNEEIKRICIEKNISKRYLSHSFRAGYITKLSEAGVPIQQIAKLVGHKYTSSTQRYDRYQLERSKMEEY